MQMLHVNPCLLANPSYITQQGPVLCSLAYTHLNWCQQSSLHHQSIPNTHPSPFHRNPFIWLCNTWTMKSAAGLRYEQYGAPFCYIIYDLREVKWRFCSRQTQCFHHHLGWGKINYSNLPLLSCNILYLQTDLSRNEVYNYFVWNVRGGALFVYGDQSSTLPLQWSIMSSHEVLALHFHHTVSTVSIISRENNTIVSCS